MKYTRQQYLDEAVTHREYYAQFVTQEIKGIVLRKIATRSRIQDALTRDEDLDTIPLEHWDAQAGAVRMLCVDDLSKSGDVYSLDTAVYILKEAARQLAEEK